jgi:hypothetical protein
MSAIVQGNFRFRAHSRRAPDDAFDVWFRGQSGHGYVRLGAAIYEHTP